MMNPFSNDKLIYVLRQVLNLLSMIAAVAAIYFFFKEMRTESILMTAVAMALKMSEHAIRYILKFLKK